MSRRLLSLALALAAAPAMANPGPDTLTVWSGGTQTRYEGELRTVDGVGAQGSVLFQANALLVLPATPEWGVAPPWPPAGSWDVVVQGLAPTEAIGCRLAYLTYSRASVHLGLACAAPAPTRRTAR